MKTNILNVITKVEAVINERGLNEVSHSFGRVSAKDCICEIDSDDVKLIELHTMLKHHKQDMSFEDFERYYDFHKLVRGICRVVLCYGNANPTTTTNTALLITIWLDLEKENSNA